MRAGTRVSTLGLTVVLAAMPARGQAIHHHHYHYFSSARPLAANVIVPQSRAYVSALPSTRHVVGAANVEITCVDVGVVILEQVATTTMDISLKNLTGSRQEAEMLIPVPVGAAIRGFTFQGAADEPTAELLPREKAKSAYSAIVAKIKDPALLEFVGCNLVRSAVFPLAPNGTQKVRLTYEHLLVADGQRIDYELPRSESIDYNVPWTLSLRIKSQQPIATVYSPSHPATTQRVADGILSVKVVEAAAREPGSFRLSYLLEGNGVSASLLAYPDPEIGGGYFLMLAGLPRSTKQNQPAIKREVILVLDRSGSMRGEKLDQVREAALQVVEGMDDGEAFNIIAYNEAISALAPDALVVGKESVALARRYLRDLKPRGGTNIHDALVEALRSTPRDGRLPIVLFLTDGLPTIGQTSERTIRNLVLKSNPHCKRVFTFGVGVDVNTPLLDRIAAATRATSSFVLPGDDVEVKVAQVFKRLAGPVLADPVLQSVTSDGKPASTRVSGVTPSPLPDMFAEDQLVVLGRYKGEAPLHFTLRGNYHGQARTFTFDFKLNKATTRNAFVPRLWASRKIAILLDAVRQAGASEDGVPPARDPRLKELVDEIVRLSTEFGILTEYTAFLAREGTDLEEHDDVLAEAMRNVSARAIATRSGLASVNQEINLQAQRRQQTLNPRNGYYDGSMNRVQVTTVQQVNDRAFYRRGNRWVDSRLAQTAETQADRVVRFGTPEYDALLDRLAAAHRQGTIALRGDVLMELDGERLLVKAQ